MRTNPALKNTPMKGKGLVGPGWWCRDAMLQCSTCSLACSSGQLYVIAVLHVAQVIAACGTSVASVCCPLLFLRPSAVHSLLSRFLNSCAVFKRWFELVVDAHFLRLQVLTMCTNVYQGLRPSGVATA